MRVPSQTSPSQTRTSGARRRVADRIADWIIDHRYDLQQLCLLIGCALLSYALLPGGALAQDGGITEAATTGLRYVKLLWAFVFLACALGLIYYLIAYFTQGLFPQLWQPVSGNWGRNALMLAIGGNVIMGIIVGAAQSSINGFAGGS